MKFFKNRQEALEKLLTVIDINAMDDMLVISINERGNFYAREIA